MKFIGETPDTRGVDARVHRKKCDVSDHIKKRKGGGGSVLQRTLCLVKKGAVGPSLDTQRGISGIHCSLRNIESPKLVSCGGKRERGRT